MLCFQKHYRWGFKGIFGRNIGAVVTLINLNSYFNKINWCLAKFWSTSSNHYPNRMKFTFSTKSFLWNFKFLSNILISSAILVIATGVFHRCFFVNEPCFIDVFTVIFCNSLWPYVTVLKISSSVTFLVTSVLNGLKFQWCFIMRCTVDLNSPVASDIPQGIQW